MVQKYASLDVVGLGLWILIGLGLWILVGLGFRNTDLDFGIRTLVFHGIRDSDMIGIRGSRFADSEFNGLRETDIFCLSRLFYLLLAPTIPFRSPDGGKWKQW